MNSLPKIDQEFKTLIPPLSADERAQLEENILTSKKCRDAIILWDGVIIDGHNRYEICTQHGIEFEIVEVEFVSRDEAKVWILENQLSRRNLSDAARIELALTMMEMLKEKAKKNLKDGGKKGGSKPLPKSSIQIEDVMHVQKELAAIADISKGTLSNYLQIKASGNQELLERVKSGELKIGTAHRMLPKEIMKQLRQAEKMYAVIHQNMPIPNNPEATRAIQNRLAGLSKKRDALIAKFESFLPKTNSEDITT